MNCVTYLVDICIQNKYVEPEKAPWLQYILEKWITSTISYVVLVILGLLIVNPATMISFLISFCSLRTVTNGFHASSFGRCLLYSVIGELIFLIILPTLLNKTMIFVGSFVSFMLILCCSPYNHPHMNLSNKEILACRKCARKRLTILGVSTVVLYTLGFENLTKGIALGVAMVASTLLLAYCLPKSMQGVG